MKKKDVLDLDLTPRELDYPGNATALECGENVVIRIFPRRLPNGERSWAINPDLWQDMHKRKANTVFVEFASSQNKDLSLRDLQTLDEARQIWAMHGDFYVSHGFYRVFYDRTRTKEEQAQTGRLRL